MTARTRPDSVVRPSRREAGFALASVMFLGAVMLLLTAVIVMRASSQGSIEVNDARWEQALHVAEGGLDEFLADLVQESDPDAIDTGHTASQLTTKADVIAVADAYAEANPEEVVVTPEGEAVIIKPLDDSVVYAVGFTPDRGFDGRKARVLEIDYDYAVTRIPNFGVEHALLSGGDIDLSSGSSGVYDESGSDEALVHSNGSLTKHRNFTVEGCAISDEDQSGVGENCPSPLEVGFEMIPDVDPLVIHDLAMYELCEGGVVRAGPASGVAGRSSAGDPCTGALYGALSNVTGRLIAGVWNWDVDGGAPEGVYYVDGGNVAVTTASRDGQREITVIAATSNRDTSCSNLKSTGHVLVNAGADLAPHGSAGSLAIAAQGDVQFLGAATVEGLTMAHEQIEFRGGTGSGGAIIAEHFCDHPDSPVNGVSSVSGGAGITWAGSITTPFYGYDDELVLTILDRSER